MLVLLTWLGWGMGHALLPLLRAMPTTTSRGAEEQFLCPRGFPLTARAPFHRHGQVCTRTHDHPPTGTYALTHFLAIGRLPRPFVPSLPPRNDQPPLKPHPPSSLPPSLYVLCRLVPTPRSSRLQRDDEKHGKRYVEMWVACCGLLCSGGGEGRDRWMMEGPLACLA